MLILLGAGGTAGGNFRHGILDLRRAVTCNVAKYEPFARELKHFPRHVVTAYPLELQRHVAPGLEICVRYAQMDLGEAALPFAIGLEAEVHGAHPSLVGASAG